MYDTAGLYAPRIHQLTQWDIDECLRWLRAPHPDLDDRTPLNMLQAENYFTVEELAVTDAEKRFTR